jgi:hypothetical protein
MIGKFGAWPCVCSIERVDRQPDGLHPAPVELRLQARHVAELGRADWGEVAWVGEQDHPAVARPVVEADVALSCFGREVRGVVAKP